MNHEPTASEGLWLSMRESQKRVKVRINAEGGEEGGPCTKRSGDIGRGARCPFHIGRGKYGSLHTYKSCGKREGTNFSVTFALFCKVATKTEQSTLMSLSLALGRFNVFYIY